MHSKFSRCTGAYDTKKTVFIFAHWRTKIKIRTFGANLMRVIYSET